MAGVTTAFANQAKKDFLFGTNKAGSDTFKLCLIKTGATGTYDKNTLGVGIATTGAPTTSLVGDDHQVSSGTYTIGGVALAAPAVSLSTDTAVLTFTSPISYTTATISAIGAIIFNDTTNGVPTASIVKPAIAVLSFSGTIASTNGTFTINLPTADAANGLIRIV